MTAKNLENNVLNIFSCKVQFLIYFFIPIFLQVFSKEQEIARQIRLEGASYGKQKKTLDFEILICLKQILISTMTHGCKI